MGSALSNLVDTLIDLLHLTVLRGTDQIQNLRVRLYNVRGVSAGVCDRIVDSRFRNHMLS